MKVNILANIFEYVNLLRKCNSVARRSRKLTFVVSDIKLKAFFNFDRHFKKFRFLSLHISAESSSAWDIDANIV